VADKCLNIIILIVRKLTRKILHLESNYSSVKLKDAGESENKWWNVFINMMTRTNLTFASLFYNANYNSYYYKNKKILHGYRQFMLKNIWLISLMDETLFLYQSDAYHR